jgi:ferritin-like protein
MERDHIMQFFAYAHLPERLQAVSRPFCELAEWMVANLPRNPERSAGLRKLVEAKDCAVRALLAKEG